MANLIEQVAVALGNEEKLRKQLIDHWAEAGCGYYDGMEAEVDKFLAELARAAIRAMGEPTEAMKAAYWKHLGDMGLCEGPLPEYAFRVMIDAALAHTVD